MAERTPDKLIKVSESTRIHLFCFKTSVLIGWPIALFIFHSFTWCAIVIPLFLLTNLIIRKTPSIRSFALKSVPEEIPVYYGSNGEIGPGPDGRTSMGSPTGYDFPSPQSTLSLSRSTSGSYY